MANPFIEKYLSQEIIPVKLAESKEK